MAEEARTIAKQSGMGAIPNAKGVTFRVWAPHAEKVYVIGSFNDWSRSRNTSGQRAERILVD